MRSDQQSEIFARTKQRWSRPVDEDGVLVHLSYADGDTFCGIEKRHPDVYNMGFEPIRDLDKSAIHVCKLCFKIYKNNLQK